ncbi:MAG: 23S rRNA (pseudouridine(1915)-N(3))-methyltransferase RlmH [Firmicutes bacterium HGW-Firmicutes-21]|nr:MAG: 23S rRNA (pseudouridine(1915)-N(3))-methyltransferase RlmH [Firmicutes bacterium HGW-Firmicutes-21]
MPNIYVLHVGESKADYLTQAENEYIKRLQPFCTYTTIAIKEERLPENEENAALIERSLKNEAERIRQKLPKKCFKIALCIEGKRLASEGFSSLINDKLQACSEIAFIIGSSHGLDEAFKKECDFLLSMSGMTFPHRLMRPILAEQVYRAFTIISGKKYHK